MKTEIRNCMNELDTFMKQKGLRTITVECRHGYRGAHLDLPKIRTTIPSVFFRKIVRQYRDTNLLAVNESSYMFIIDEKDIDVITGLVIRMNHIYKYINRNSKYSD